MAHINFVIPANKAEFLDESNESIYYVRNLVVPKDIASSLKNARAALKDEGAEFIIDSFDLYYSIVHHGDLLKMDAVFRAYEDLHRGATELNRALGFLLEDKESLNDEIRMKNLTIIKMLLYMYTQIVMYLDQKNEFNNRGVINRKKSKTDDDEYYTIDKSNVLLVLNNIIQREINLFWDPPVVEENFINMVSEVCYRFLQNPTIKNDKEVRVEIFNLIGTLIKSYSHGTTFVLRMVQLLKIHDHVVHCLPDGIQQLVDRFNCKGIVHDLICEITEWQTDEKFQDSQGAKHCGMVLTSLAALMPVLMLPEAMYLMKYLDSESPTLRNSVLAVVAEVILNVLSGHEVTEEEAENRNEFLNILHDHMHDVSVHVRARVMQHWARLQEESVIPLKFQNQVLEGVVERLGDRGALVRKSAVHCVTTFLTHNGYSAFLSLSAMQKELEAKEGVLRGYLEDLRLKRLGDIEARWDVVKDELVAVIREELEKGKDDGKRESEANEMTPEQIEEIVRMYLQEGKYKEAFKMCQKIDRDQYKKLKENSDPDPVAEYVVLFQFIFADVRKLERELKSGTMQGTFGLTHDDLKQIEPLQTDIDFLRDCVAFLNLIDGAILPISQLLETTVIGDMHAAVEFFVSAYQFNIDNASLGILAMLKIMQRNEPERRDHIVDAFKTIYLHTDGNNMSEHCGIIVKRLVSFVKSVPLGNVDDLHLIISEWTAKGILDNSVIDVLWQYFTRKVPVSADDSRAASELLRMCAMGRKTVISRNIKLVAMLAFGELGERDMLFLGSACRLLAVAGKERIDIDSKTTPFRFKPDDALFKDFMEILKKKFFEDVDFYNQALEGGIDFIYRLCSKPEVLSDELLGHVINKLAESSEQEEEVQLHSFLLVRLCHLLGMIAIKLLDYLDETVYRELKRRNNIREERKATKKSTVKKRTKQRGIVLTLPSGANESALNASLAEESILEGAQAEDTDAEFILNVLENDIVTGSGTLGKLAYIVRDICERPDVYDDPILQGVAAIAFIRYMLVSSKFCSQNIQLLFTIFERTQFSDLKCSILVHLSDLLTRFPNIVEPWMPRIYQRIGDPDVLVRKATFFTLSSLILRDMIRAHSHISIMACCIVEEDKELSAMCKTFFVNLSHKENDLYNVLPDIFSHLMDTSTISEENGREIMRYLFQLMDKAKHMENLVDRFCCKYKLTEDKRQHRDITYCLTLIHYNEKGLKKLIENFPLYKHLMHDAEIYGSFKGIIQSCGKVQVGKSDLKSLASELEANISSVFELNEDGNLMKPPPVPSKKPKTRTLSRRKKSARKAQDSDSDDDYESVREPPSETPERPRVSRAKKIRGG